MDGFKLLETVGLELDLPVISEWFKSMIDFLAMHITLASKSAISGTGAAVMSSNGDTPVVLRGVTHGAVDFLIKPVRIEELRNVWQHVVRRRRDQVGSPAGRPS